jgi:hypothetical protein
LFEEAKREEAIRRGIQLRPYGIVDSAIGRGSVLHFKRVDFEAGRQQVPITKATKNVFPILDPLVRKS